MRGECCMGRSHTTPTRIDGPQMLAAKSNVGCCSHLTLTRACVPVHERRACPSSTSREALEERRRLWLGAAQRGFGGRYDSCTRPTVGFSASHLISTERASMDTRLCVHLCLVFNFRGFFQRRQCPRRGSQLAVRGKTSAAPYVLRRLLPCVEAMSCTGHDNQAVP